MDVKGKIMDTPYKDGSVSSLEVIRRLGGMNANEFIRSYVLNICTHFPSVLLSIQSYI